MSNWITLTIQDLYNSAAAPYIDRANSADLGAGQAKRTDGIMADVTGEIRRKVSKASVVDSDPAKIPKGLKPIAVDLCIFRIKRAIGIKLEDDDLRILAAHERSLNRIADGEDEVDLPDNPIPSSQVTQNALPQPAFGNSPRRRAVSSAGAGQPFSRSIGFVGQ